MADPGTITKTEYSWYARRNDYTIDCGAAETVDAARVNAKPDDVFFQVHKAIDGLTIPAESLRVLVDQTGQLSTDTIKKARDISFWHWETVFLFGIVTRKDFLIDALQRVPNKYLRGKTFRYIYALYMREYVDHGAHITPADFKQKLIDNIKIKDAWKELINMCFRVVVMIRQSITQDQFDLAIAEIIDYAKCRKFDEVMREAVDLRTQGSIEDADAKLSGYLHTFRDGRANRPRSLAQMAHYSLDAYEHSPVYNFQLFSERLNKIVGGGWKGESWILAGGTGDGKTTLAVNLVYDPMKMGDNILFVPLEMSAKELEILFQARIAYDMGLHHITVEKIKRRMFVGTEYEDYKKVVAKQHEYKNLYILQPEGKFTMKDLEAEIDRLKSTMNLDIVVVDYLELMDPECRYESVRVKVKEMMRSARLLGVKKNVWMIVPHQINREGRRAAEKRSDPYYELWDLQESGGVEQNAVVVLWIYQDDEYKAEHRAKMGIAKFRMGKTAREGWEIGTDHEHWRLYEDGLTIMKGRPRPAVDDDIDL